MVPCYITNLNGDVVDVIDMKDARRVLAVLGDSMKNAAKKQIAAQLVFDEERTSDSENNLTAAIVEFKEAGGKWSAYHSDVDAAQTKERARIVAHWQRIDAKANKHAYERGKKALIAHNEALLAEERVKTEARKADRELSIRLLRAEREKIKQDWAATEDGERKPKRAKK